MCDNNPCGDLLLFACYSTSCHCLSIVDKTLCVSATKKARFESFGLLALNLYRNQYKNMLTTVVKEFGTLGRDFSAKVG